MILDDLLMKCMDNHAVENCRDCPEQSHCLLLKVIHEHSQRNPEMLDDLQPLLSQAELSFVQQVEERYSSQDEVQAETVRPIRVPSFLAVLLAMLLRLLEWTGYGVMALLALIMTLALSYGLGLLLWWLPGLLAGVVGPLLAGLTAAPTAEPSLEPTPEVSPSPAKRGADSALKLPAGRLHLISNQEGIQVRLRDEVENKQLVLPSLYQELPPGPYELLAEKPGFVPYHASIIVLPSSTTTVQVIFKPSAGKLRVRSRPPQVQVRLDGTFRGTTTTDPLVISGLAAGSHDLEAIKAGYRHLERTIELEQRQDHELMVSLEQAQGQLSVATQPARARVLLDGRERGSTGRNGLWQAQVPAGSHHVSARKQGYRDASPVTVEVEDRGEKQVAVELEPLAASGVRRPASGEGALADETQQERPEPVEPSSRVKRRAARHQQPSAPVSSHPEDEGQVAQQPMAAMVRPRQPAPQEPVIQGLRASPTTSRTRSLPSYPGAGRRTPDAVPAHDWPVYAGNPALTGNRDDRPLRHGSRRWRTRVGKFWRAVAVGHSVFVGSMDGHVYALERHNGRVRWRFATGGAIWTSPVVQRGRLYIGSDDGNVYALSVDTGQLLWRHAIGSALRGSPSIAGSTVVFGSEDGRLTALRLSTAAERDREAWTFRAGSAIRAAPTLAQNMLLVGTRGSTIVAVDAYNGEKVWDREAYGWKLFSFWDTLGPVRVPIAYGSRRLYVARTDNKDRRTQSDIHVLDLQSGNRLASGTIHGYGTAPVFYRDTIFLGSGDGHLYALDARTLRTRWRYNTGHYLTSTPSVGGGLVAFGCFDRNLYVLSAANGRLLYRFRAGGIVSSAPTLVDGQLFFGSEDEYLYAYE